MELLRNGTLLRMIETGIRFSAKTLTGTNVKNLVRLEFHNMKHKLLVFITERYFQSLFTMTSEYLGPIWGWDDALGTMLIHY